MKFTLMAVLSLLSLASFAQSYERSISEKLKRLEAALEVGDVSRLNVYDQSNVDSALDQALTILGRNRSQFPGDRPGRPGPMGPGPIDMGRPGGRDGQITVTALVESTLIQLSGRGPGDLLIQCGQAMNSVSGSIDDVIYTVNGDRYVVMHNSTSYWDRGAVCNLLLDSVSRADASYLGPRLSVAGTIETRPISLRGDRGEVLAACADQVRGMGYADDITLSINNRPLRQAHNSASYWTGPAVICGQIGRMIDAEM